MPILFIAMSYNNEMVIFKHSNIWKLLIVYCVGVNSKFISKLGCIWMVPLSVDSIATSILFTTISDDDKLIVFKNSYPWASLAFNSVWIHSKLIHACFEISPTNFSINFIIRISSYNEPVIWEHSNSWHTRINHLWGMLTVNFEFRSFFLPICLVSLSHDIVVAALFITESNYDIPSILKYSNVWSNLIFCFFGIYSKFISDFNNLKFFLGCC